MCTARTGTHRWWSAHNCAMAGNTWLDTKDESTHAVLISSLNRAIVSNLYLYLYL